MRCPIYYTVGFSVNDVTQHPQWVARNADGTPHGYDYDLSAKPTDPKPVFSWLFLCPSGDYRKLILEQSAEICRLFDVDGFWYDICFNPCWCDNCLREMRDMGLDPKNPRDAHAQNTHKWQSLMEQCSGIIRDRHPEATIFFNSSTDIDEPQWHSAISQFELEDLPSTSGGYDQLAPGAVLCRQGQAHRRHERQVPHRMGRVRRIQAS